MKLTEFTTIHQRLFKLLKSIQIKMRIIYIYNAYKTHYLKFGGFIKSG